MFAIELIMTEVQIWDCCQVAKKEIYTIALLGSTGKVGGWVLEMALERGHTVRALVRNLDNVDDYSNYVQVEKLFVIEGNEIICVYLQRWLYDFIIVTGCISITQSCKYIC